MSGSDSLENFSPAQNEGKNESISLITPPATPARRLARFLLQWRNLLLALAALLTLLSWGPARQLSLERSLESLFAPGHPLLTEYQQSKALFGGDEFVFVVWKQDQLLSGTSLQKLTQFAEQLNQIPGVNAPSTQTLSSLLQPGKLKFLSSLFLRIPNLRQQALDFAEGVVIGKDHTTTAIVLRLFPADQAPIPREETIHRIRQLANAQPEQVFVAGEPVQIHDMFEIVEEDGALLGWASTFALLLVTWFLFRSLRWMLLPIAVVQASLLWTQAFLVISEIRLSMVSSMFSSLMTILGIATVMHITVTFRRHRQQLARREALEETLTELLPWIFWMCVTTAVGFGALMTSQIVPVRSFGLMMVIGTFVMLLAVACLVPGLVLLGGISIDPRKNRWEIHLTTLLQKLLNLTRKRPRGIGFFTAVITLIALVGTRNLQVETDFSKNFHDDSLIAQALQFVESNLGGAGVYEVSFQFDNPDSSEQLDKLRTLATQLRELRIGENLALTKVVAYTDGVDFIPSLAARSFEDKKALLDQLQPEFSTSLHAPAENRMRIVLRSYERVPAEQKLAAIHQVKTLAEQHFPDVRVTGLYVLLANIIQSLLSDQLVSFLLATAGIFLMMSIAFRSVTIGLISLIPNLFPIAMLIGILGWSGSLINIGTAMIASVSVGLTVDSSIHYLAAYGRAKKAGLNHDQALQLAQENIGLALIFSNIALICGFSVLLLSNFVPLNYFGALVSIAMLGGLIGNIILLPLLLTWREKFFAAVSSQPLHTVNPDHG